MTAAARTGTLLAVAALAGATLLWWGRGTAILLDLGAAVAACF